LFRVSWRRWYGRAKHPPADAHAQATQVLVKGVFVDKAALDAKKAAEEAKKAAKEAAKAAKAAEDGVKDMSV
jgi:hypothetical protein